MRLHPLHTRRLLTLPYRHGRRLVRARARCLTPCARPAPRAQAYTTLSLRWFPMRMRSTSLGSPPAGSRCRCGRGARAQAPRGGAQKRPWRPRTGARVRENCNVNENAKRGESLTVTLCTFCISLAHPRKITLHVIHCLHDCLMFMCENAKPQPTVQKPKRQRVTSHPQAAPWPYGQRGLRLRRSFLVAKCNQRP